MKLVKKVNQLCVILSSDSVTAREVAIALGAIEKDEGEGGEIIVRPTDPVFKEAVVVCEDDSNAPAYIELALSRSGRIAVKELKLAFGDYSELPQLHWDSPAQIMFMVEQPSHSYGCAILAQYEPAGSDSEMGTVSAITIRRDEL